MKRALLSVFWLLCLPLAWAQIDDADRPNVSLTVVDGAIPADDAHIVRFYVDEATPESGYETGSLHIIYSDKTQVVEKVRPKEKSTEENIAFNEEGISEPKIAEDKRTIAWTEQFDNCCTSYTVPIVLAIYRSGKNIVHLHLRLMVWDWMFSDGGKHVAAVWGTVHFSDIGDYQLYDADTGRMIDQVMGDAEIEGKHGPMHGLGANAPGWAKELARRQ